MDYKIGQRVGLLVANGIRYEITVEKEIYGCANCAFHGLFGCMAHEPLKTTCEQNAIIYNIGKPLNIKPKKRNNSMKVIYTPL